MNRFNPFPKLSCAYGSPMGRRSMNPGFDESMSLCARKQGGDGYYDQGGAYWGSSAEGPVWAVWERAHGNDGVVYVRARSREAAIAKAFDA